MPCVQQLGVPCYSLFARGKLWVQTATPQDAIDIAQSFSGHDNPIVRERIEYADGEVESTIWPPATLP